MELIIRRMLRVLNISHFSAGLVMETWMWGTPVNTLPLIRFWFECFLCVNCSQTDRQIFYTHTDEGWTVHVTNMSLTSIHFVHKQWNGNWLLKTRLFMNVFLRDSALAGIPAVLFYARFNMFPPLGLPLSKDSAFSLSNWSIEQKHIFLCLFGVKVW